VAQLKGQELGEVVALPPAMFGGPEGQSLDEMRPEEVGEAVGRRVVTGRRGLARSVSPFLEQELGMGNCVIAGRHG